MATEMRRHGDAQFSPRFRELISSKRIGGFGLGQHQPAPLIIGAAEIGQALAARGPVDETHAKPVLKKPDMLADHRSG